MGNRSRGPGGNNSPGAGLVHLFSAPEDQTPPGMTNFKTLYLCQECGAESSKWIGKCPSCGPWNTYVEEIVSTDKKALSAQTVSSASKPVLLDDVSSLHLERINVGMAEFNRVLGGGLVPGSLVLIGGEPGIGKSTLVLQLALTLKGKKILYASGEESL